MIDKITYKILAKHFSEKNNIRVIFEEGACPATDGKNIILPTELSSKALNSTLGALLHEAGHIRKTSFNSLEGLTEPVAETLNVLEDIRIDNLIRKQYPNSIDLQKTLINHVIKTKRKELLKETLPRQVLKGLILKSYDYKPEDLYCKEIVELIDEYSNYIDIAVKAKSTQDLIEPAKALTAVLINKVINNINSNGGDSPFSKIKKQFEKNQNILELTEKEKEEAYTEYRKEEEEYRKIRRKTRLNQTKSYNAERKLRYGDITQEKVDEQIKKTQNLEKELQKQADKLSKISDFCRNKRNELYEAREKLEKINEELKKEESLLYGGKDKSSDLIGFKAIDKDLLKTENSIEIDAKQSLEEIIREALISKKEKYQVNEDGNKLNESRLADIYCSDIDNLFLSKEKKEFKTKIAFLIDASPSMGGLWQKEKADLAVESVKLMANALQKAINEDAPADFDIYAFANRVARLTEGYNDYNGDTLPNLYTQSRSRLGGGTELLNAVNTVAEELKGDGEEGDKVAIVITDAEVYEEELKQLINQANNADIRFIFIAIKATLDNEEAIYLFEDRNIENIEEAIDIIRKAILND